VVWWVGPLHQVGAVPLASSSTTVDANQNAFLHLPYQTWSVSLMEMCVSCFLILCLLAHEYYPKLRDFANFVSLFSAFALMHAVRDFIIGPDHQTLQARTLSCLSSYITQQCQNWVKCSLFLQLHSETAVQQLFASKCFTSTFFLKHIRTCLQRVQFTFFPLPLRTDSATTTLATRRACALTAQLRPWAGPKFVRHSAAKPRSLSIKKV